MVNKALLTIRKGTRLPETGISVAHRYEQVLISPEKLEGFNQYFGFTKMLPLPFLYLFAQRVQAALMLDPAYTLSIPGTIHLTNQLQQLAPIDPTAPFDLEGQGNVAYKPTGSLLPSFQVRFFQHNTLVAQCSSGYLVKRKNKSRESRSTRTAPEPLSNPYFHETWVLESHTGKTYAQVSDDHNPIHKSKTAARLAGFKSPLVQGWYLVSRAARSLELQLGRPAKAIQVNFIKPVLLPGSCVLCIGSKTNNSTETLFQLLDPNHETVLMEGSIATPIE